MINTLFLNNKIGGENMHLIVPIAGQSSRFPGLRPKWMLNHPNGNLMIAQSIYGLDLSNIEEIIVICLKEHEDQYSVKNMLFKQFQKINLADKLRVIVIEESQSQPHTVYQGLKLANVEGPIFIKDSDNFFTYKPDSANSVCYACFEDLNRGNVTNKSYILQNESGRILNIVEKRVISDRFCCGGYSFADAFEFIKVYEQLQNIPNLYISHLIYQMILNGVTFSGKRVHNYLDWGTLEDWDAYRNRFCTLFVDLDGTLVENSAEFMSPFWGETDPIRDNIEVINRLYESGYGEIIITTTRSQEYEQVTHEQLARIGLKYHRILFGIFHSKRIVINDYSKSNPYRSCEAINLNRNSSQLAEMLQGVVPLP